MTRHALFLPAMNSSENCPKFEALLHHLKDNQGCDLMGYKRSVLMQRFEHRMRNINVANYQSYLQYLQTHSEEYLALLSDVLINVTRFFRDPDDWSYLLSEVISKIIANKQPNEPIRVWSAGCASGQEIYSLLIVLAEAIGIESCLQRVQCYATDADEGALGQAQQGIYSDREVATIPADWLEKYFKLSNQKYVFHPKLRRTVVFGQHNLMKNAPMPKIDLLICRNVLIYFNLEAQASILAQFHVALKNTGFLFLGRSETLFNHKQMFLPVHVKHRVYMKGANLSLVGQSSIGSDLLQKRSADRLFLKNRFWRTAFETNSVAQVAVNLDGCLVSANQQANLLFGLTPKDWNCPLVHLKPGKLIATHPSETNFYDSRRLVVLKNLEWNDALEKRYFDVTIVPVLNFKKDFFGTVMTFEDTTSQIHRREKLESVDAELVRVSKTLEATQIKLEAAYREIKLLNCAPQHN